MKKTLLIAAFFTLTCLTFSSKVVYAQQDPLPVLDFIKELLKMSPQTPTDCPENQRDSSGKCINMSDLAQRCWYEDKIDINNQYNEACCRTDDQCPNGQRCNVGNDFCKSGSSCNPGNISGPEPTAPPGQPNPPTQGPRSTAPPGADNFTYYCQGKPPDNRTSWGDCNMGSLGCGMTTFAMILTYFGETQDPEQVNGRLIKITRPNCSSETAFKKSIDILFANYQVSENLVEYTRNSRGQITSSRFNVERAQTYLQNGYLIAALASNFPCGAGCPTRRPLSHMFVIQAIDDMLYIRDPSNCNYNNGQESPDFRRREYKVVNEEAYAIKK